MRLIDADRLKEDIETAVEDAPMHIQVTVQQYIDCTPTIDPIRAAGGCRCKECTFSKGSVHNKSVICTLYSNPIRVDEENGCLQGELRHG